MILYWISPLAYRVQARFRKVKYITLVNLLAAGELFPADTRPYDPDGPDAEEALFPEYLTCQDKSPQIARHAIEWLTDKGARERLVERLERLKAEVGHGGASARAGRVYRGRAWPTAEPAGRPASCARRQRGGPPKHGGRRGLSLAHFERRRAPAGAAW